MLPASTAIYVPAVPNTAENVIGWTIQLDANTMAKIDSEAPISSSDGNTPYVIARYILGRKQATMVVDTVI